MTNTACIYDEIYNFEKENLQKTFENSTHEIVSKVAYLIGVPEQFFHYDSYNLELDVFKKLEESNRHAKILRCLCMIRTAIFRAYKHLCSKISENRSFLTLGEYVSQEAVDYLLQEHIPIFNKRNIQNIRDQIIDVNKLILDRVNNVRDLFPIWVNFDYIKKLFIMPNGLTRAGVNAASELFYSNMTSYPFKCYLNWLPQNVGNILFNDKKFMSHLYRMNGDEFFDYSKISDVPETTKTQIQKFLCHSRKTCMLVDCENVNPYHVVAMLASLDSENSNKLHSIFLFDDQKYTSAAWDIVRDYTSVTVHHIQVDRLKDNKSLLDHAIITRACQLYYQETVDSFMLVSSDSDFWMLINSLNANFLVMLERATTSAVLKNALIANNVFYCYLDDFYSGNRNIQELTHRSIVREMHRYIEKCGPHFNIHDMFIKSLMQVQLHMSDSEKKQFFEKYVKTLTMHIDADGNSSFVFKPYH